MGRIKTRCHFSIIFERLWKFWAVLLVFLFQEIDTIVDVVRDIGVKSFSQIWQEGGFFGAAAFLIIMLGILVFGFLRWRKTWIILEGNLIIVERNTLQKKKNTIALENVSSVNIERNIFERIVGTSRIKIDTASLTTSNQTDVSIVLKEDKAIAFRKAILDRISYFKGTKQEEALNVMESPEEVPRDILMSGKVITYKPSQMAAHGIYSASIFNILFTVGGTIGLIWFISSASSKGEDVLEMLGGIFAIVLMVLGSAYNLVKKFIVYYNFRVFRDGDELHLRYGLLKLKSYTLPIDKIVTINILQPTISRLCKRYQVTVKTVGLTDENGETPNLTLAVSKKDLISQMNMLLPEYNFEEMLDSVEKEAKGANRVRAFKFIKWAIIFSVIGFLAATADDITWWMSAIGTAAILIFIVSLYVLSGKTAGLALMEQLIVLVNGQFQKTYTICKYDKIQQITVASHPVGRKHGIVDGVCQMLADSAGIPYVDYETMNKITKKITEAGVY